MKLEQLLQESSVMKFTVYRIGGRNPKELANRNAGDRVGMLSWMGDWDLGEWKYETGKNKILSKFEVRLLAPIDDKTYDKFTGEWYRDYGEHTPDPDGLRVGSRPTPTHKGVKGYWYSFPHNGAWEATHKKSIPLKKFFEQGDIENIIKTYGQISSSFAQPTNVHHLILDQLKKQMGY